MGLGVVPATCQYDVLEVQFAIEGVRRVGVCLTIRIKVSVRVRVRGLGLGVTFVAYSTAWSKNVPSVLVVMGSLSPDGPLKGIRIMFMIGPCGSL